MIRCIQEELIRLGYERGSQEWKRGYVRLHYRWRTHGDVKVTVKRGVKVQPETGVDEATLRKRAHQREWYRKMKRMAHLGEQVRKTLEAVHDT